MMCNIEVIQAALKSQQRMYRFFQVVLILLASVITYWYFEPDPLNVNYVQGDNTWSTCKDRQFPLLRDVQSSKDLNISIKQFWWNIDDINGKMNEYPHSELEQYTISAGTDRIFDFPKEEKKLQPVTFSQISLSYQINSIHVGVEHHRHFNKFGVAGLDESVNQLKLTYNF